MPSYPNFVRKTKSELKKTICWNMALTPIIIPTSIKPKTEILTISVMNTGIWKSRMRHFWSWEKMIKYKNVEHNYFEQLKSKVWLFEGYYAGEKYHERSLELVFKLALRSTNIIRPASLHWLKHFMLSSKEAETVLRYIQELLDYSSTRTTEIHTHVCTKNL